MSAILGESIREPVADVDAAEIVGTAYPPQGGLRDATSLLGVLLGLLFL